MPNEPTDREVLLMLMSHPKRQRGAALVEFALVVMILVMMLYAIVQYGMIINTLSTLSYLSQVGCRYASVHSDDVNADKNSTTSGSIAYYVATVANTTTVKPSDITISVTPLQNDTVNRAAGKPISVSVQYDMGKRSYFGGFVPGVKAGTNIVTKQTTELIE